MDVEELLRPLTRGEAPDVERVYERVATRSRRRRAVLAVGCVAVIALLGAALWLTPRDKAAVSTVGDPQADTATQVRRVIDTLFLEGPTLQEKLAQIDDSTGLEAVLAQGMQDDRAHRLTLTIVDLDLSNPTVVAHIEFFLDGMTAMPDGLLELRHNVDRWQAIRASYCALIATGGLQCPTEGATSDPGAITVITTHAANQFGPQIRLLDAPIADIPSLTIRSDGAVVLSFRASSGEYALQLEPASGGAASLSGNPLVAPPLVVGGSFQTDPNLSGPWSYVFGVTRSEVARIELWRGTFDEAPPATIPPAVSVETFAVDGIPHLRFFLVSFEVVPADGLTVIGYAADGTRLTDSHQK